MTLSSMQLAANTSAIRSLPNGARSRGILKMGAPGVGKSRLIGRLLAVSDLINDRPQAIIDPIGGTIDNFLDKVLFIQTYLPAAERKKLWERIVYIDMGSADVVCPFLLYYHIGMERSLREIADRYLDLILKCNPWLLTAQVLGWPPLHEIGLHTGMVLAALDLQITSAQDMLRHPEQWEKTDRFAEAKKRNPEAVPAVAWFREEFIPIRPADRRRLTNPFFEKIFTFNLDRQLKAMFGSSTPGLKWDDVERKRQTVLLDFRYVPGEHRRFLLLWVFSYLYEWIKTRSRSSTPFGLIIDEFVALTQKVLAGENPLAVELDELIQQYMRQHQIWLTIGLQSPHQLDDHLQQTVFSLGTYLIGQAATMQGARILADAMFLREPYLVKHFRPVYGRLSRAEYEVIDEQPQFMPLNEQLEQAALRIRKLGMFQFLVRRQQAQTEQPKAIRKSTTNSSQEERGAND